MIEPHFVVYRALHDIRRAAVPYEHVHILTADPMWRTERTPVGLRQCFIRCVVVHVHDGHQREASVICAEMDVHCVPWALVFGSMLGQSTDLRSSLAPRPWPDPPEGTLIQVYTEEEAASSCSRLR